MKNITGNKKITHEGYLAVSTGVEPVTYSLEGSCSIQLSYETVGDLIVSYYT